MERALEKKQPARIRTDSFFSINISPLLNEVKIFGSSPI
jgi:hypothetical protein